MLHDKSILRISDVSQILSVSIPTIFRWQRIGHFPKATKYGPKMVGWPRHVVEQWVEEKERPASSTKQQ